MPMHNKCKLNSKSNYIWDITSNYLGPNPQPQNISAGKPRARPKLLCYIAVMLHGDDWRAMAFAGVGF